MHFLERRGTINFFTFKSPVKLHGGHTNRFVIFLFVERILGLGGKKNERCEFVYHRSRLEIGL